MNLRDRNVESGRSSNAHHEAGLGYRQDRSAHGGIQRDRFDGDESLVTTEVTREPIFSGSRDQAHEALWHS